MSGGKPTCQPTVGTETGPWIDDLRWPISFVQRPKLLVGRDGKTISETAKYDYYYDDDFPDSRILANESHVSTHYLLHAALDHCN